MNTTTKLMDLIPQSKPLVGRKGLVVGIAIGRSIAYGCAEVFRAVGAELADMLALTAGVGEHSAVLRERIGRALGWLGLEIDTEANVASAFTVSRASSRVRVAVEPTNEEWIVASHALLALR